MATKETKEQTQETNISSFFMKGEKALRGAAALTNTNSGITQVSPQELKTSPFQPRRASAGRIRRLADQIKPTGLLQPVTARRLDDGSLELIAGHGRRDAFILLHEEAATNDDKAKWSKIPCVVLSNVSDLDSAALGAAENLGREDLTPVEEADALLSVKKAGQFTTAEQVAQRMGLGVQKTTKLLQLAESPAFLQRAVFPGVKVTTTSAKGDVTEEVRAIPYTVALEVRRFYLRILKATDEKVATRRSETLLARAAKGDWSRDRVVSEIDKLFKGKADAEDEASDEASSVTSGDGEPSSKVTRKVVFQDQGGRLLIYPQNIATAERSELDALTRKLRELLAMTEKPAA